MMRFNPARDLQMGRVTRLANRRCPYCGLPLDQSNSNLDHVIGRNFVPKGTLNVQWNLLIRTCKRCNAEKSSLEDDISAITLQPDVSGMRPYNDTSMIARADEKAAKSRSRLTKKPVRDSFEALRAKFDRFGASIIINFKGSSRIHPERVAKLASMHLSAFMLLITFDETTGLGSTGAPDAIIVDEARWRDWGNARQRAFMSQVSAWDANLLVTTGQGFFQVAIRRHPTDLCWSWALEWNKQLRVIGYFGDVDPVAQAEDALPEFQRMVIENDGGRTTTIRKEVPLSDELDVMFRPSEL